MLILSQEVWKTAYVASVPGVQGRSLLVEGHTMSNKEPRTHRGSEPVACPQELLLLRGVREPCTRLLSGVRGDAGEASSRGRC